MYRTLKSYKRRTLSLPGSEARTVPTELFGCRRLCFSTTRRGENRYWKLFVDLEAQGEAPQYMQVYSRHAVASRLSAASLSLSVSLSLLEAAGETLDHYLEVPTHLLPSLSL